MDIALLQTWNPPPPACHISHAHPTHTPTYKRLLKGLRKPCNRDIISVKHPTPELSQVFLSTESARHTDIDTSSRTLAVTTRRRTTPRSSRLSVHFCSSSRIPSMRRMQQPAVTRRTHSARAQCHGMSSSRYLISIPSRQPPGGGVPEAAPGWGGGCCRVARRGRAARRSVHAVRGG